MENKETRGSETAKKDVYEPSELVKWLNSHLEIPKDKEGCDKRKWIKD